MEMNISDDEGEIDDLSAKGASIYSNPNITSFQPSQKFRFRSLIAIGNPIVDITAEIEEDIINKYNLKLGGKVFANEENIGLFEELEKNKNVKYIPGGAIQNTLRIISQCINMESKFSNFFKITMLGAIGNDTYREKIVNGFSLSGVNYILETIPDAQTSRCAVCISKKMGTLLADIKASNKISEKFIKEHREEIYKNDALLIEGFFIKERFEIIKNLCYKFKIKKKIVILTLSSVDTVKNNYDKFIDLAKCSDLIVGNTEEFEELLAEKGLKEKDLFIKLSQRLVNKSRLFIVTNGKRGVIVAKYDYKRENMDFILKSFPSRIKDEDIVDLNGAGDAFLGGFLSQYMLGKSFEACCKAGNDVAGVVIKNIGCNFPKNVKIKFRD